MHASGDSGHECGRFHGCHSSRGTAVVNTKTQRHSPANRPCSHTTPAIPLHLCPPNTAVKDSISVMLQEKCANLQEKCANLRSRAQRWAAQSQVLLEAAKAWKREGVRLALASPNPQILHICESAGLLDVLGKHASPDMYGSKSFHKPFECNKPALRCPHLSTHGSIEYQAVCSTRMITVLRCSLVSTAPKSNRCR
jgi:hypothetical protein